MDRFWLYEIMGETPAKKNGQTFNTRFKRMVKSSHFTEWHNGALTLLKCSRRPEKPLEYAKITVTFRHADLRRRDGDNSLSSIQDLLQDAEIIRDDSWTRIGTPTVRHELALKPSVFIEVEEIDPVPWAKMLKALQPPRKRVKTKIIYNANL